MGQESATVNFIEFDHCVLLASLDGFKPLPTPISPVGSLRDGLKSLGRADPRIPGVVVVYSVWSMSGFFMAMASRAQEQEPLETRPIRAREH